MVQRCTNVTVQSTVVVVLFLGGTLLVLDAYKWRRLALPWYPTFTGERFGDQERGDLMPTFSAEPTDHTRSKIVGQESSEQGASISPTTSKESSGILESPPRSSQTTAIVDLPLHPSIKSASPSPSQLPSPLESAIKILSPLPSQYPLRRPDSAQARGVKKPMTSLEKLEFGLRQVRLAIRDALLAGENGTEKNSREHYEPYGDVYRNAATFRKSYREMERRFKVYAYPEGDEPLVHNGPCKEIYAIEGRFIQELQGENPFLTLDPDQAHVFFLPFSVAMMVTFLYEPESGNMDSLQHFVKDYVDVVVHKHPYWNQSGGADHFMLSCHDWGPAVSSINPDLASRSIRVLCNANTSEGYVPWKDASLPEINLVGGILSAELGGPSAAERLHLAFFAGHDHGPVRPQLFKHWEGKDNDMKVYHSLPQSLNYHELMKRSRFCICPGGYEVNSPRIVESIYNGCVPVIIADSFVLPFSDVLNWPAFSVRVKENDIPNLKVILQSISMESYTAMQEKVMQVQRHFLLHQPPQRYDVFHMILHSVWLRRLNIQIGSS